MRGLAVFISDIRNCKSKEAEIKRINKELANIRSKFKVVLFCFEVGLTKTLFYRETKLLMGIRLSYWPILNQTRK